MTGTSTRRSARWAVPLVLAAIALIAVALWVRRPRAEIAPGLDPEPIAPFGPVARADLVFRWAVPSDGAPVRVEVLNADDPERSVWKSESVFGGTLTPDGQSLKSWPLADLLWRPVAVPAMGGERRADLAAFTLLP